MFNKTILVGNLTRDVELKFLNNSAVAKTGIATSRKYKGKGGEKKEEVMFIDLVFWGRTAEVAGQYLKKGSRVLIDGRLELSQWTSPEGAARSKHSVVVENLQMLPTGKTAGYEQEEGGYSAPNSGGSNYGQSKSPSIEDGGFDIDSYSAASTDKKQYSTPQQNEEVEKKTTLDDFPSIDLDDEEIPF